MGRIESAPHGNILSCESAQTSLWSLSTRELESPAKEARQMVCAGCKRVS